jgi:MFS family permease
VSFLADVSSELVYGLLPAYYLGTLSLGIVTIGLIEGAAEAIVSVAKFASGHLSDRSGRRKVWMVIGYGLSGAAKPLMALAASGAGLGALRAADRLGKGLRGAPRDALIAGAVDAGDRGRAFGVQRSLDHAGALAGGLLAVLLVGAAMASPRDLFVWAGIPGAAAVAVILVFVKERRAGAAAPAARRSFSPTAAWRESASPLRRYVLAATIFALAKSSDVMLLALCYERFVAAGMTESASAAMLPALWVLLHVVRSAGTPIGGALSDRLGRVPVLTAAWLVHAATCASAAAYAAGGHVMWAWPLFALYGVHAALGEAPEKAIVADLEPDAARRGTAFGLVHLVQGIATLPATVLVALLWESRGAEWAFGAAGGIALIAILALRRVR